MTTQTDTFPIWLVDHHNSAMANRHREWPSLGGKTNAGAPSGRSRNPELEVGIPAMGQSEQKRSGQLFRFVGLPHHLLVPGV
jgi:hypothetical protein